MKILNQLRVNSPKYYADVLQFRNVAKYPFREIKAIYNRGRCNFFWNFPYIFLYMLLIRSFILCRGLIHQAHITISMNKIR